MDIMRYAVLLRARNDLVERSAELPLMPEGYALFQNHTFQTSLDMLDPDLPCAVETPVAAAFAYIIGRFHITQTAGWFKSGMTMDEYRAWYSYHQVQ